MHNVFIVTCPGLAYGTNPGLSQPGRALCEKLLALLPPSISQVITGTGVRHRDTLHTLGFANHPKQFVNPMWGTADTLEIQDDRALVLTMASGEKALLDPNSNQPARQSMHLTIRSLAHGTVIISGTETIQGLFSTAGHVQPGQVIKVTVNDRSIWGDNLGPM